MLLFPDSALVPKLRLEHRTKARAVRVKFPFWFSRVQEAYILISLQNFCPNLGQTYEHIKTHFAAPIGQEIEKIVKKSQKLEDQQQE